MAKSFGGFASVFEQLQYDIEDYETKRASEQEATAELAQYTNAADKAKAASAAAYAKVSAGLERLKSLIEEVSKEVSAPADEPASDELADATKS